MASEGQNPPLNMAGRAEEGEDERLSGLLKRCRARIANECASLGPYLRVPMRVGKTITQEEVAEATGISRQWYALLESDHLTRVSPTVLARIADALMMDSSERAALFRLAVPELHSAPLTTRSTAILEAFGSLRRFTRRLWAATTEAEVLTLVREHAMTELAPDAMVTCTRADDGRWDDAATGEHGDRVKRLHALLCEHCRPGAIDDYHCFPLLARPGELMTHAERDGRFPELADFRRALDVGDWIAFSSVMALVRSEHGFVAVLQAVHDTPHAFSEVECAQLSTLADLTSLALTGRV